MDGLRLAVCLPSFNEAQNLGELIRDTHAAAPEALIVVIDDGSTDGTGQIAMDASASIPVDLVTHPRNLGLARALQSGFDYALERVGDDGFIILMDADGTHRPEQIPDLVREAEQGADLVVAGRYLAGSAVRGVPPHRKILSLGARLITRAFFGDLGARDVSCGYRLYRAALLRRGKKAYGEKFIVSEGFSVNVEVLVKLARIGAVITQIPLNLRYDLKKGASKIRIARTIFQYLHLFFYLRFCSPGPLTEQANPELLR